VWLTLVELLLDVRIHVHGAAAVEPLQLQGDSLHVHMMSHQSLSSVRLLSMQAWLEGSCADLLFLHTDLYWQAAHIQHI
jgi:hypothetical protein